MDNLEIKVEGKIEYKKTKNWQGEEVIDKIIHADIEKLLQLDSLQLNTDTLRIIYFECSAWADVLEIRKRNIIDDDLRKYIRAFKYDIYFENVKAISKSGKTYITKNSTHIKRL